MPRGLAAALILLAGLVPPAAARDARPLGSAEATRSAQRLGQALTSERLGELASLLPQQGKVRVRLGCLGPEQGSLSAEQLTAMLQDFLRCGSVHSFEIVRAEAEPDRYALVQALAGLVDRDGRKRLLRLDLTFQPEGGSWILREMRESAP